MLDAYGPFSSRIDTSERCAQKKPTKSEFGRPTLFVTYAQNFEDLMLWRALSHVGHGFYIDVGANHPLHESVTKVFYDAGWNGINIEPDPDPFGELVRQRPRDINLNVGAWSSAGRTVFHTVEGLSAYSTLSDFHHTEHLRNGRPTRDIEVELVDLRSVCEQHVGSREIHFLKVDVEGVEPEVFTGHDFSRWRPWVILFESHGPDPKTTYHLVTEQILLDAGYSHVYFDGLNSFYVSDERRTALAGAFLSPPNVYDDWIRYRDIRFSPPELRPQGVIIP